MEKTESTVPTQDTDTATTEATTTASPQVSPALKKAQGYAGVLAVIAVAGVLFSPESPYRADFPRTSSYTSKTLLAELVAQNWRARFINKPDQFTQSCTWAQERASQTLFLTQKERAERTRMLRERCDPYEVFIEIGPALDLLLDADPKYWDKIEELGQLRKKARVAAGLGEDEPPPQTAEMAPLVEALGRTYDAVQHDARTWLHRTSVVAHVAVFVFTLLGLVARRAVGAVLLAPIGWMCSLGIGSIEVAKTVHKKI